MAAAPADNRRQLPVTTPTAAMAPVALRMFERAEMRLKIVSSSPARPADKAARLPGITNWAGAAGKAAHSPAAWAKQGAASTTAVTAAPAAPRAKADRAVMAMPIRARAGSPVTEAAVGAAAIRPRAAILA